MGEVGPMRNRPDLLLAELHAHSTWSDGCLPIPALVDLYGSHGVDVLCITDHVHPPDDPWARLGVPADRFGEYVAEIEGEAERAREQYGLLVVPGSELTVNHADPDLAAHAVAVGLRSYVSLVEGLERGLVAAREAGAARGLNGARWSLAPERRQSTTACSSLAQCRSVFQPKRCSIRWKSPAATAGSWASATQP